jgi:hypothetical protein
MATDPIKIDSERLLLCEGKTTNLVLGPLLRRYEIRGFQPIDFGSKDHFSDFIQDLRLVPGFSVGVKSIAIVRDAETEAPNAFASVRRSLLAAGLPSPDAAGKTVDGPPQVGVFIVPDNASPGMIETLCMQSVEDDPAVGCVREFFDCVADRAGRRPANIHKARAQAFLATLETVDYHVGRAADRGSWNFDHRAFGPLIEFLRRLAG